MFARLLCSAALSACLALPVMAESTTQPVIFAAGATGTAVTGQVTGRDTADFTLTAEAGQVMNVRMNADNSSAYFNIYAPGDVPGQSQALFIGSTSGSTANLTLPASGTYLIRAYLMASAGRENESARFSLTFDVTGRKPQSSDVANALNSEPDYWKVTGITGTLNIRAEASTAAAVAGTVANDATLRNLGCQAVDGRNWCKVETVSGTPLTGWAASDFLAAGSPPADAAAATAQPTAPAPAQVPAAPGTPTGGSTASSAAATLASSLASQPPATQPPATQPPSTQPVTAAAPQPAPAAPAGTTAPTDRPAVVSTRPPAAPPSKIPLGGASRQSVPPASATAAASSAAALSSSKPAPKPVRAAAAAAASDTATGSLPCSTALGMPTRDCAFSVTRSGPGTATIRVTWPGGGLREIRFENGAPAPASQQTTEKRGDLTVINIGNERYEIPDAVVNGG